PIKVRLKIHGENKIERTTVGRIEFNRLLPVEFGFYNTAVDAKMIKEIVTEAIEKQPQDRVAQLIDDIKQTGFEAATKSGLSVSVTDCEMIEEKDEIIEQANRRVEDIQQNYQEGLITNEERKKLTYQIWMETTDVVADKTWESYSSKNAVKVMIDSGGTRAS